MVSVTGDSGVRHLLCPSDRTRVRLKVLENRFVSLSPRVRYSPVSNARRGFTLIELLIVVVIIGILAAIAIPKFGSTKAKAYFAGMESDLHNLTTAEESYFYDHAKYTAALDSLSYNMSHGDTVVVVAASVSGWSATVANPASYPHFCALFMGSATAVAPATSAGVVACQ